MQDVIGRLKTVIVQCPYDNFDRPEIKKLLPDIFEFKIQGYRDEHPYGVLPIDGTDIVGNHMLICLEENDRLIPLVGCRSITLDRCQTHNLAFPLINYIKPLDLPDHERAVQSILDYCSSNRIGISFDSSWTISPLLKSDPALRHEVGQIFKALHVAYHDDYGIPQCLVAGVMRFHLDKIYKFLGYQALSWQGRELSTIQLPFIFNETVGVFYLKRFSEDARRLLDKYPQVWRNRLDLGKIEFPKREAA